MSSLHDLAAQFGSSSVKFDTVQGGLTRCNIDNSSATAQIYLQGAHVTGFQPRGKQPVLWLSDQSNFETGKPIRGGIPICWPWFGPHNSQPDWPAHGFARTGWWRLNSVEETEEETRILCEWNDSAISQKYLDYQFKATYEVTVGPQLTVALTIQNLNDRPMEEIGCALHTYFSISRIDAIAIEGLEGCPFLDKLTGKQFTVHSPISIDTEVDRVYQGTANPISIIDQQMERVIKVFSSGSNSTVVWNPWIDKSQRLNDFPDDGYLEMVCIETANALDDVRKIEPGQSHRISQTIRIDA